MKSYMTTMFVFLMCITGAVSSHGSDWPQFRYDAQRSAACPDALPAKLSLHWVREFPAPRPAFPLEVRLRFDGSYEPVVATKTMFVPSMVTDSVTALNTESGQVRWQFFAEAPVLFAPVAWEGKVFFTSDDGHMYCVDASDGKLCWKFRGLPPSQRDRKILGHGRLISLWPTRGGAVLADGVIYFAAGLWPGDGVYIYALDALSGKVRWLNSDSNMIPNANMDHGISNFAGLTPQGYMAMVDGKLVVPCGAQLPAFLDPKTGAVGDYNMGWGGRDGLPKGSWFVAGTGKYLSHSGDLYDISKQNDEEFRDTSRPNFKSELYAGGFARLRIEPKNLRGLGNFEQPVLADNVMYSNDGGIVAHDLTTPQSEEWDKNAVPAYRKTDVFPDKLWTTFPELWKLPLDMDVHIKAGDHLYLGGDGIVQAVNLGSKGATPEVVWRAKIAGTPNRMLAAAGKLFVVTRQGAIYAFGEARETTPARYAAPSGSLGATDAWVAKTAEILNITEAREGYALVLGLETGRLVAELINQSELLVIAVDRDAKKIDRLRRKLAEAGLYGTRASAHVGDPARFEFPPYLADLVVSEDPASLGALDGGALAETVFHPLRPYGGTACLAASLVGTERSLKGLAGEDFPGLSVRDAGEWTLLRRTGPLPDSSNWSHAEADASSAGASEDSFIEAPLGLLWFDASRRWHRKVGATAVRVSGGRTIVKGETMLAVDVYTGRHMWEAKLPFPHSRGDQLVAMEDAIYVTSGRACHVFNPETGEKSGTIPLPEHLAEPWANLRVQGDYLVGQSGKFVVCTERKTGRTIWEFECGRPDLSIALGEDRVFCSELANTRRGKSMSDGAPMLALGLKTGDLLWEIADGSAIRYARALDYVVSSIAVYRGSDGTPVTSLPKRESIGKLTEGPLMVVGKKLLWGTEPRFGVLDMATGERVGDTTSWGRRGCTGIRASSNLVTTRYKANAAIFDIESRDLTQMWNVRPACNNNLFPANGLLNMPSLTGGCECNYSPVSQAYAPLAKIRCATTK